MTTITLNNREFVFVPVPDGATSIKYFSSYGGAFNPPAIVFKIEGDKEKYIILPEDKYKFTRYRIVTTTTTIAKPIAKSIVEAKYGEFYVDYTNPDGFFGCPFASFESLLEKHSLTGRYAVIEKI